MANPFDDDFEAAGGRSVAAPFKSYTSSKPVSNSIDDDVDYYNRQIEQCMQQSLDSTQRSRVNLEQSEQTGIKVAQDLLEQREKLERTNANLDNIDKTTVQTQRNLNNIKSVFGGLVNRFSRSVNPKQKEEKNVSGQQKTNSNNKLEKTIGTLYNSDSAGPMAFGGSSLSESSRQAIKGSRWEQMDNEIDENLDSMSSNLKRLQAMGLGLGQEIDDQNKLLDSIQSKAEKTDSTVRNQDRQMKKILGYKEPKQGSDSNKTK